MARKKVEPAPVVMNPELIKAKVEGLKIIRPIRDDADELEVNTPEDYQFAENLLIRINQAEMHWAARVAPIVDPINRAMAELKASLKGVSNLSDEILQPLHQLGNVTREKMRLFKLREAREIRAAKEAQEQERQRLAEAEKRTTERLMSATGSLKARLNRQLETIVTQQQETEESVPEAVQTEHSTVRRIKQWRVTDLRTVLQGIIDGTIPEDIIIWNAPAINRIHGIDAIATWPGFEVYEDIQIARRG